MSQTFRIRRVRNKASGRLSLLSTAQNYFPKLNQVERDCEHITDEQSYVTDV